MVGLILLCESRPLNNSPKTKNICFAGTEIAKTIFVSPVFQWSQSCI